MLVSFSVQNFKSFSHKQEFSMVTGKGTKDLEKFSFATLNHKVPNLLRSTGIFGSNGSGKSSLVEAMAFSRNFIIHSAQKMQEGDEIEVKPHLFDKEYFQSPSEFEFVFIHNNSLYQYGFSVDDERVYEEWLFSRPNDAELRTRHLFSRSYNSEGEYDWYINDNFVKGDKNVWKNSTRSNSLFLSQAVQLNSVSLKDPFDWFRQKLKFLDRSQSYKDIQFTVKKYEEGYSSKILQLLNSVDMRIVDMELNIEDITEKYLPDDIPDAIKKDLLKKKMVDIKTVHKTKSRGKVELEFTEESSGTQNVFGLSGYWLDSLENGNVLIVDELHNNLHPNALEHLIYLFNDKDINKNNAQLIFTSHETTVMTYDFMHKEQYWITDKTPQENTQIIPLSNYDIKKSNNIQKSYLNGRYRGVPILKRFKNGN